MRILYSGLVPRSRGRNRIIHGSRSNAAVKVIRSEHLLSTKVSILFSVEAKKVSVQYNTRQPSPIKKLVYRCQATGMEERIRQQHRCLLGNFMYSFIQEDHEQSRLQAIRWTASIAGSLRGNESGSTHALREFYFETAHRGAVISKIVFFSCPSSCPGATLPPRVRPKYDHIDSTGSTAAYRIRQRIICM